MLVWEIIEHVKIHPNDEWNITVFLDVFLVILSSIIINIVIHSLEKEIHEKDAAHHIVTQRNTELTSLYVLATHINKAGEFDKTLNIILSTIFQITCFRWGNVWLLDEANNRLLLKTSLGIRVQEQMSVMDAPFSTIFETGEPVFFHNDDTSVPNTDPVLQNYPIKNAAYIPILVHNKPIGAIHLYATSEEKLNPRDIDFIHAIASQTSVAIERTNLYETIQQHIAKITILQGIALLANESLNLEEMCNTVTSSLGLVFVELSFSIYLLENDRLVKRGESQSPANKSISPDIDGCYRAIQSQEPAFLPVNRTALQTHFEQIFIPLVIKNKPLGILNIIGGTKQQLSDRDVELFASLGSQISVGIHHAQLYGEVKTLNSRLEALVQERTAELYASREEITEKANQLQQLLEEVTRIQDEERDRIAFDMHDGLTQLVIGALYECDAAEYFLENKIDNVPEKIQSIQHLLQQVNDELYSIIHDLHSPGITVMGLLPTIKRYLESYRELVGIFCELIVSGNVFRLNPSEETAIYRIVQEALHNIGKHAQATSAFISFDFGVKNLIITIQDNGTGMDIKNLKTLPEQHLGLRGLKRRAKIINSTLSIQSAPNKGTQITLTVPNPSSVSQEYGSEK